jgi:hypothetical protein
MNHTPVAMAARAWMDAAGLRWARRVSISWTAYLSDGGPKLQR